jgi:hypothetical protein
MAIRYQDYTAIAHVAKTYYKDDNMCTVIALAMAAGIGYGKAFHTYRRLGRKTGKGTLKALQVAAFKEHGLQVLETSPYKFGATLKTAAKSGVKGTYLIYSRAHVSAMVDGKMYDWGATSCKRIKGVYTVVPV